MRVIKSHRAGVGKSLKTRKMSEKLSKAYPRRTNTTVKMPLHEKVVNTEAVIEALLPYSPVPGAHQTRIFHFDLAHEVFVSVF